MSVLFGRWNFDGQAPSPEYVEKVSAILSPFGPDGKKRYDNGGLTILYHGFHTTKESHREVQPCVLPSGEVITWDGRLDNRRELIDELRGSLSSEATDLAIVSAAYEEWGIKCLGKLIGDWALSIWNPRERSLLLAKDPIGTRHLYYAMEKDYVAWSTILDPLVQFAERTFTICEEYIAGWFSCRPAVHLTPYAGIHAVPPSSSVLLRPRKHGVQSTVNKYWDFDQGKRIRYRTDAGYEEHFRTVFATAVERRLRSDRPVLAELSGGVDSSCIVCMADSIIARSQAELPRLDTITWYDESNRTWGELPRVTQVEEKRGRVGRHIDAGSLKEDRSPIAFGAEFAGDHLAVTPVPNSRTSEFFKQNAAYIKSQGYRVTLSGIGGEEATGGGVPTPTPELQNLLARARFLKLARQLKVWAAKMKTPRLPVFWDAVRGFFPPMFRTLPEYINPAASWFHPRFVHRNRAALHGYDSRVKLFGALPSFQHNIDDLDLNRRVLACPSLRPELPREVRYPYFDIDLLAFAYAIPREQMVGVGKRRFLLRRALAGIVPDEILNRKKTELAPQEAQKSAQTVWPSWAELGWSMAGGSIGIIDTDRFADALQKAQRNEEVQFKSLNPTLLLESWLRHLATLKVLGSESWPVAKKKHSTLASGIFRQHKSSAS